jgi:hypothetical protein
MISIGNNADLFFDRVIAIAYIGHLNLLNMIAYLFRIENKNIQFGSKVYKKDVSVIKTHTSLINLF